MKKTKKMFSKSYKFSFLVCLLNGVRTMKNKYEDDAKNQIAKLKNEIEKSIDQLGKQPIIIILENYFGLSRTEAVKFIGLVERMDYLEAGYDTVPQNWFFETIGKVFKKGDDGKRRLSETVGHLSKKIIKEREEVRQTIKRFRDLQNDKKEIAIKHWPKEYQSLLINDNSNKEFDYWDFFPSNIANKIIAERWMVSIDSIKKYIKKETAKKPSK